MQKGRVLILGSVFILLILPGLYFRCLSQITLKESSISITPTRQDEVMRKNLNKKTKFSDIAEEFLLTDPASLITVQTAQDVTIRRRKIISFLWGESVNPIHVFPNNVITNVPSLIQGESNLIDHTDQLNIKMEHGLESNVFLLFPKNRQSKFVLFHIGHDDGISTTLFAIESFLSRGYLVGVAFMPTTGPNNKPIVWTNDHGSLMMNNHQALSFLDLREGHPIKFFLHPIIVTLNYVEKKYQCELMVMSGLSGGGWATIVASALDPRIDASFPVAGGNPFFLKTDEGMGDFEQSDPAFYNLADFMDLFVMGAYGKGRIQVRIYNKFDTCCFFGEKSKFSQPAIDEALKHLGEGRSRVFVNDDVFIHAFSKQAVGQILLSLGESL